MTGSNEGFSLTVQVPAEDWAYLSRRAAYLEAVLIHVLRDRSRIQEWYDAAELAALRLPGLPATKAGITRSAGRTGWRRREATGVGGRRYQYHYASLPARAFDALIGRILDVAGMPPDDAAPPAGTGPAMPAMPPVPESPARAEDDNTAPPWVLPFMRLLKGAAHGDITAAWNALPGHLPPGVALPTRDEAAETILRLGLVKDA